MPDFAASSSSRLRKKSHVNFLVIISGAVSREDYIYLVGLRYGADFFCSLLGLLVLENADLAATNKCFAAITIAIGMTDRL